MYRLFLAPSHVIRSTASYSVVALFFSVFLSGCNRDPSADLLCPEPFLRQEAARELMTNPVRSPDVVLTLANAIQGEKKRGIKELMCAALVNNSSRVQGMRQIHLMGLKRLLGSSESHVRDAALRALYNIGKDARQLMPDVVACLTDSSESTQAAAARALERMGQLSAEAVDALRRLLEDSSNDLIFYAARTLAIAGEAAPQALPILIDALKSSDSMRRASSLDAIGKSGEGGVHVEAIVRCLNDPVADVRYFAWRAIGELQSVEKEQLRRLTRLMNQETDKKVQRAAVRGIENLGR